MQAIALSAYADPSALPNDIRIYEYGNEFNGYRSVFHNSGSILITASSLNDIRKQLDVMKKAFEIYEHCSAECRDDINEELDKQKSLCPYKVYDICSVYSETDDVYKRYETKRTIVIIIIILIVILVFIAIISYYNNRNRYYRRDREYW